MYLYKMVLHGKVQDKKRNNSNVEWVRASVLPILLMTCMYVCVCVCVCRNRTSNYENTISGRSNRNISLLAGVRSLWKYRNDGGPFRINLIIAFCRRATNT